MRKAGTQDDPNLGMLTLVATALGDLRSSLVFVGGCATGLLITTSRSESIRATQDVARFPELMKRVKQLAALNSV